MTVQEIHALLNACVRHHAGGRKARSRSRSMAIVIYAVRKPRSRVSESGTIEYVGALAKAQLSERLSCFIANNETELRKNNLTWGSVANAFVTLQKYEAVPQWMHDRDIHELKPWILLSLVISLHSLGRVSEARAAADDALKLSYDHGTSTLRAWVAWHEAVEGNFDAARDRLNDVNHKEIGEYYKPLCRFTDALLESHYRSDRVAFGIASNTVAQTVLQTKWIWKDKLMKNAYLGTIDRIAIRRNGIFTTLWRWACIVEAYLHML
jgi:hypothetical protein